MSDHDFIGIIKAYWRERGYNVDVSMGKFHARGAQGGLYEYQAIRSNMRNEYPRGYRGDRAPLADVQTQWRVGNG